MSWREESKNINLISPKAFSRWQKREVSSFKWKDEEEILTNWYGSCSHVLHNTNAEVFIYHRMHSCHRTSQKFHQVPVNWPRLKVQTWIKTLGLSSLSFLQVKAKCNGMLSQYMMSSWENMPQTQRQRMYTRNTEGKKKADTFIRIKLTEPKELQIKKMVIKLKQTWNLRWGDQLQIIKHERNS